MNSLHSYTSFFSRWKTDQSKNIFDMADKKKSTNKLKCIKMSQMSLSDFLSSGLHHCFQADCSYVALYKPVYFGSGSDYSYFHY